MTFYYQNQRWYCHNCRKYNQPIQQRVQTSYHQTPGNQPPVQNYAYAPQAYQPPAPVMTESLAQSKIRGAVSMRQSTDQIISTRWAIAILLLQVLVPIITFAMLYLVLVGTTITLSNAAQIALIIAVFISAVAMVIVMAGLAYKLVKRRDEHFRRDGLLRLGMMEYLDAISVKERRDINVERWTMNTMFYSDQKGGRGPALWAMMIGLIAIIPIVGVFATLYCLHFLTKDVQDHDRSQNQFNNQFQIGMMKLGKISEIHYDWSPVPTRESGAYILLSILTLGFFMPYWWYVNIVDMNQHLKNQWVFEAQLIKMVKPLDKEAQKEKPEAANEVPPES